MNFIASAGWLRTKGMNSRRSMMKISQLVFAVASAVRASPIEHRDFAENLARSDQIQDRGAPVRG